MAVGSMKKCCCGVDVHKSFIIAVVAKFTDEEVVFTNPMRFSTYTHGLREFKEWLRWNNCYEICMESTGKYYMPVYRVVSDEQFHVDVVHPKTQRQEERQEGRKKNR